MKKFRHLFGGVKAIGIIVFTFLLFPFAKLFLFRKHIWLISEYGYEARDNGYIFFKYMREQHKEVNCYYAIDFHSADYHKIKELGNAVKFGSFKHFAYFCAADYIISSKTQGFCPSYYLSLLRKKIHLWGKYVFLQHGITHNNQTFLYKKPSKIDLFICGAKPEYDDVKEKYGYKDNEVVYTGFARFDTYHNIKPKNQILIMPTWRRYAENVEFSKTSFFKTWSEFIKSKELNELLAKHSIKGYFYLHPHFKNYIDLFAIDQTNISILSFEGCDLQEEIRNSKLYITDFSSLAFDFGYMRRPVIYYQYDKDSFYSSHYIKGYYDYFKDGFGPVCYDLKSVIKRIDEIITNNFIPSSEAKNNQTRFFPVFDDKNSERIYLAITNLKE